MSRALTLAVFLLTLLCLLAACSDGATVVSVEQSVGSGQAGEPVTAIVTFDPAAVTITSEAVPGECDASVTVPGAYRCTAESTLFDPCFAMADGRLMCSPNPVSQTYSVLIDPGSVLPGPAVRDADDYPFFIELAGNVSVCALRTATEPVFVAGVQALYDCDKPYTYVMGFEKSKPVWEAAIFELDPATGSSTSGKIPADVVRAWVP